MILAMSTLKCQEFDTPDSTFSINPNLMHEQEKQRCLLEAQNLTDKQFAALKEYYVDRIVDNMSMKDLVRYVTDDMQRWIDDLTFNDVW